MSWGTALLATPPHPPTARHLREAVAGPVVLADGVALPSAPAVELVVAFHHFVTWRRPDAHLVVAGASGEPVALAALMAYVRRLNLSTCWVLADADDAIRAACWARADLVVLPTGAGRRDDVAATAALAGVRLLAQGDGPDDALRAGPPRTLAEAMAVALPGRGATGIGVVAS